MEKFAILYAFVPVVLNTVFDPSKTSKSRDTVDKGEKGNVKRGEDGRTRHETNMTKSVPISTHHVSYNVLYKRRAT